MPSQGEHRKTVTVLFCDLAGSTALGESLDPERLRALLARYFEEMKGIVEHHGGTVEKFIGDAVMAVFGVPTLHEDDALRAVRAAVEMRDALPELGLEGRIGVMTGEVVTGTEERLATGDPVNVAARLEQAAAPGEVLIGEPTLDLVRGAVDVEPIDPLVLKGKAEPVPAYRLLRVGDPPERRHDTRFVGRERELALLREAWNRVRMERCCELVTVVGEAGVGKSRLIEETLAFVEATVVRARCLPYGDGITYWPVVEVLEQLGLRPTDEAAAVAIRSLLGESEARTSADEIAWAFRKTLEHAAAHEPLVVVVDDIQWGVATFHDLLEQIPLLSADAPILVLCMARPELVERRPTWPVTLRLEPLDDAAVAALLDERVSDDLRERITRAAGGNPLFVREMLAIAGTSNGDVVVPPTLRALLSARLDQLPAEERSVLECGAVEGEVFHRGAVQLLAPDGSRVTPRLAALVRKQLISPHRPQVEGDDAFRFRHLLIRDAAYDALPKSVRAALHRQLGSWLEARRADFVELDEILGHHLEQAHRYRSELGLPDDDGLAAAARQRLAAGGHRATRRQDYYAAVSLFERAAALMGPSEVDLPLESELATALSWIGRPDDAARRADALAERAAAAGDRIGELCGRIQGAVCRLELEPHAAEELSVLLEQALPLLEAAGDDLPLYIGYSALGELADIRNRYDAALEAWERAFAHAEAAGYQPSWIMALRAFCRFAGSMPVSAGLAWIEETEANVGRDLFLRAYRAWSLAKLGEFDEARAILADAREEQAERGGGTLLANLTAFESVWVELLAGDPATAAEYGAEGCRLHEQLGGIRFLPAAEATLAHALYALDRLDEARAWADLAAELCGDTDVWTQRLWRQVKAKALARDGEHAAARRLAEEAVTIADDTDALDFQGDAYADLAEVLVLAGERNEAAAALAQALDRYGRKGNLVSAGRVRERLAGLRGAPGR